MVLFGSLIRLSHLPFINTDCNLLLPLRPCTPPHSIHDEHFCALQHYYSQYPLKLSHPSILPSTATASPTVSHELSFALRTRIAE